MLQSIILLLALFMTWLTVIGFTVEITKVYKFNEPKIKLYSELIIGSLAIIFWSYFYYLNL